MDILRPREWKSHKRGKIFSFFMDRLFGFGVFSARFRGLRLIALDYLARSPQNISFSFSRLDKKKSPQVLINQHTSFWSRALMKLTKSSFVVIKHEFWVDFEWGINLNFINGYLITRSDVKFRFFSFHDLKSHQIAAMWIASSAVNLAALQHHFNFHFNLCNWTTRTERQESISDRILCLLYLPPRHHHRAQQSEKNKRTPKKKPVLSLV